ncbi:hypothetical protein [Alkalicoccobacillus plakortidis]|uniref:Uncharacterized protein n=1 Tax=Alkalicoccobacillus plakortidis TaxID=444060 RepID=A0ABT0XIN8_9BACI|nr:hypothetical protein [Alkalicoccobacillus plakortidis]MCM2675744.1 hypothetical protein [Alkalicoccobacillus plakortidis]
MGTKQTHEVIEDEQLPIDGITDANLYEINRKVTHLSWNGGLMKINGYAYFSGIPLEKDDHIYKAIVLRNNDDEKERFEFPLHDLDNFEEEKYKWAGFEGEINFSSVTKGGAPLPNGSYNMFIKLTLLNTSLGVIEREVPLGNINRFLKNNFHSTKLEYYTAKRHLQYNLMVTQNIKLKTLQA